MMEETLKKEIEKERKKHGGIKDMFATIDGICKDVDEFIDNVLYLGFSVIKQDVDCEKIFLKTSRELNEKLKDIPENKEVWERIYNEIPACLMHHTFRGENPDDANDSFIMVFTDLKSEGGKRQSKSIRKQLKDINF